MKRPLVLALAAAATLFGATAVQAARVDGSIGIGVPPLVDASRPRLIVESAPLFAPPPLAYLPRLHVWLPPLPPLLRLPWIGHDHRHHDGRIGWRR
jgi:hypothetical protein